jgi:hypothetical protein
MQSSRAWLRRAAIALVLSVSLPSVAPADPRSVSLAVPVLASVSPGHAILRISSAELLHYGLLSGEPVAISIGTSFVRAHVAFKDELERAATYYASIGEPEPFEPGLRLVLDRLDPRAQAELDSRTAGAEMPLGTQPGQVIKLQFVPAGSGVRSFRR